ncbi:MAG TPA: alpha/beta hydrolase [Xanthomonadales bacterium]|nr:alpha/beta hydrolase [Xanthomonadales bacterium]
MERTVLVKKIRKWLFRLLVVLLILLVAGFVFQSCSNRRDVANFPMRGSLVDINTHQLHLYCVGEGSPTVMLEAGLGNMVLSWTEVQSQLALETRICSYDRAGYGHSEPGPFPRSAGQVVNEFDKLISSAGLEPPFVLVGHSNGALYSRLYERMRPENVAGLVLIDPNPENAPNCPQLPPLIRSIYGALVALSEFGVPRLALPFLFPIPENLKKDAGEEFAALRARGPFLRALLSETDEACQLLEQVRNAGKPAAGLPVWVLSADRGANHEVTTLHTLWVKSVPGTEIRVIEDSGHWIQRDRPEVVIDVVTTVVEQVRAR